MGCFFIMQFEKSCVFVSFFIFVFLVQGSVVFGKLSVMIFLNLVLKCLSLVMLNFID